MNKDFKILTTCFYCLSRAFPSEKLFLGGGVQRLHPKEALWVVREKKNRMQLSSRNLFSHKAIGHLGTQKCYQLLVVSMHRLAWVP